MTTATRQQLPVVAVAVLMWPLIALAAAPARADPPDPAPSATVAFGWPLAAPHHVVDAFDPPSEPWLPGQRGVVLAGRAGQTVVAAGAGTVSFAGRVGGISVVSITHPAADGLAADALRTTYEPVAPSVRRGQSVARGQPIGRLLAAGSECPPNACLHWGLIRGWTYLDPLSLLETGIVRLFPVTTGRFGS